MRRYVLGVLAFWPLLMFAALVAAFVFLDEERMSTFVWFWAGGTAFFMVGWIYFMVDSFRNDRVPRDQRALWAALLFFAGPYVMPFYYWKFFRPERESRD